MILDRSIYFQTIWYIRRYWDFLIEYEDIINGSPIPSEVKSSSPSNPTEAKYFRAEKVKKEIDIIEAALDIVPEEYREGILCNIILRERYPSNFNSKTYKKWKRRFVYAVANKKDFI